MTTYVVGTVIIAAMGYALYRVIKNSLSGKSSCSGNCAGCSSSKSVNTQ